jgi:hypothetical protein
MLRKLSCPEDHNNNKVMGYYAENKKLELRK